MLWCGQEGGHNPQKSWENALGEPIMAPLNHNGFLAYVAHLSFPACSCSSERK